MGARIRCNNRRGGPPWFESCDSDDMVNVSDDLRSRVLKAQKLRKIQRESKDDANCTNLLTTHVSHRYGWFDLGKPPAGLPCGRFSPSLERLSCCVSAVVSDVAYSEDGSLRDWDSSFSDVLLEAVRSKGDSADLEKIRAALGRTRP